MSITIYKRKTVSVFEMMLGGVIWDVKLGFRFPENYGNFYRVNLFLLLYENRSNEEKYEMAGLFCELLHYMLPLTGCSKKSVFFSGIIVECFLYEKKYSVNIIAFFATS